ncbi:hypothetical protein [Natronoarchaeum rubrum]|uniref:hypothetical protein n=1 Tax=Natronoarchaeum rubrum TaxID=755311 RepID=UPI00211113B1|nr:hypothetical protein [Natronoarchaeum rubrum]
MAKLDLRSERADATPDRSTTLADDVVQGAIGGAFATVVLTAYRLPVARSLPPTAAFWERYAGDGDAEDYPGIGLVLHLLYGAGGGAVFGAIYRAFGVAELPEHGRETAGMVLATAYGLALSAFGSRIVLGRLLKMDLDPDESLVFHVGHLVYALALGTWVGSRVGERE